MSETKRLIKIIALCSVAIGGVLGSASLHGSLGTILFTAIFVGLIHFNQERVREWVWKVD